MASHRPSHTLDAYAALQSCTPGTRGGTYLRRFWHPIGRLGDLAPGGVQKLRVLGEDFALVCFADGNHALFDDRCPHRGAPLSLGAVPPRAVSPGSETPGSETPGSESAGSMQDHSLRCAYHGWHFDPQGNNVLAPGEPEHRCGAAKARTRPLAEAFGLLFAWLGSDPPAPLPFAGVQPKGMHPWRLAPIEWPCNFLLRLENTTDFSHLQGAHTGSGFAAWLPPDYRQKYEALPTGHQIVLEADTDPHNVLHEQALGHPMTWTRPHFFHYRQPLFPGEPWRQHLTWHTPAADDLCRTFTVALAPASNAEQLRQLHPEHVATGTDVVQHAEAILAGRVRLTDLLDHPNLTELEDCVMVVGQHRAGGILPSVLGRTDVGVASLRQRLGRDLLASETPGWSPPDRTDLLRRLLVTDPH